eukprot:CAMPEP_0203818518 /NCGR_PEP_ID=MMETSP0115-20131106/31886_1 /ASSEMBLY_ACC=CAM_ASM_000227 /TAXON_ID=33651 /ORGANISM="Bicosoecid sp, Strain ms1" /LENGTH=34 /DNA_ID= /DNA_START= /DNA_END= /DNA_ORIENTATION=
MVTTCMLDPDPSIRIERQAVHDAKAEQRSQTSYR